MTTSKLHAGAQVLLRPLATCHANIVNTTGMFYENLFETAPVVEPLFSNNMVTQGNLLMSVLGTAVSGLDNLGATVPVVQALGERHVGYGVKYEHYDHVGASLLWTLGTLKEPTNCVDGAPDGAAADFFACHHKCC
jgi:hemoglobin-like flavoprotein